MTKKTPKKRVAFLGVRGLPADRRGAGGGERAIDAQATRLAKRGYDVTVYCRWNFHRHPPEYYNGVRLVSLPTVLGTGVETLSHSLVAVLHTIFSDSSDIVCMQGVGNALYIPLLRLAGKHSIVFMDGIDWERPKWGPLARFLLRLGTSSAYRWGDAVTADNRTSQRRFEEIYQKAPVLLPLGADLWEYPGSDKVEALDLEPNNYILFVGMLVPDKGVHLLVEAYKQLDTSVPLVLVGDTVDYPEYKEQLQQMANERVRFVGFRYGEEVRQLFANCRIYVQPSVMEGNSPSLMSAMACGRCVVVNGIEQNRETIGDAGIAFDEGDVDDLRAKLEWLLQDDAQARVLGQRAKERIDTVYSWENTVDGLQSILEEL